MEQRLVDPRLLAALQYMQTWRELTADDKALAKKVLAGFTALASEETLMEDAIRKLELFMTEMRSVGLSAEEVAVAHTMARRLTVAKTALSVAERAVVTAEVSMEEVRACSPPFCALLQRLLPFLPADKWLHKPDGLRHEIAGMQQKQTGVVMSIHEMRAALEQMEILTVQARAMTAGAP